MRGLSISGNEAYLIGSLLGRGSIEQVKNGYSLVFRFPYRQYNPIQVAIVENLLKNGSRTSSELTTVPALRVESVSSNQVSRALQLVRDWHPSHKETRGHLVHYNKTSKKWSISNRDDCRDFLDEQLKFKEREISSTDFVIKHIQTISRDMGEDSQIEKKASSFMVTYLTLKCGISNILYDKLEKEYDLDVGDVFRHMRIPKAVSSYSQEQLEEFFRGIADTTVHFDRAPIWGWMGEPGDNRLWQLRFASVCDNPGLIFDLCHIMQDYLKIPIFIINWAGLDKYRGKRDIFAEVWALNLEDFPMPLFYNAWKQEHLEACFDEDNKKLRAKKVTKQDLGQLEPCPRKSMKMPDYMKRCKGFFNCKNIPQRLLSDFQG